MFILLPTIEVQTGGRSGESSSKKSKGLREGKDGRLDTARHHRNNVREGKRPLPGPSLSFSLTSGANR